MGLVQIVWVVVSALAAVWSDAAISTVIGPDGTTYPASECWVRDKLEARICFPAPVAHTPGLTLPPYKICAWVSDGSAAAPKMLTLFFCCVSCSCVFSFMRMRDYIYDGVCLCVYVPGPLTEVTHLIISGGY